MALFKKAILKAKAYEPGAPMIPASMNLPELTIRACIIGGLISMLMGAANAYLGLFAGMTVSATIPAAVISMAVLFGIFKNSNILEVNAAKTAGAAGESLAAGVIFTIPALLIVGAWTDFNYIITTSIALAGGILGVLFTVPLRRVLIIESKLPFPEGVAAASVLKVGAKGGKQTIYIVWAMITGIVFKFAQSALNLFSEVVQGVLPIGKYSVGGSSTKTGEGFIYGGLNISVALMSVGYIIGPKISAMVLSGGMISWLILIPLLYFMGGAPSPGLSPLDSFYTIWSTQIRYVGIGMMVIGGLWTLFKMRETLAKGVTTAFKKSAGGQLRTDKDLDMKKTFIAIVLMVIPVGILYFALSGNILIASVGAIVMVVAAFLFSAVAGYLAGLVGSSNNPISGVTIATLLFASIIVMGMGATGTAGIAAVLGVAAVVCCAAAISGDVMQDFNTSYIVGATPWRVQLAEIAGVIPLALIIAPILELLRKAYGFGAGGLLAPQANMMATVAQSLFQGTTPMPFLIGGMVMAIVLIMLNLPIMPVAVGIYLPVTLSVPMMLGGIAREIIERRLNKKLGIKDEATASEAVKAAKNEALDNGTLLASGLIAGEALTGIAIAGIIVSGLDLKILQQPSDALALLVIVGIVAAIIFAVVKSAKKPEASAEKK
ncbi:MAG: oligopeptide transporter, OPT family [Candidatus Thermoplasmatota archaeon]|nr:oligopeptide transporter, OPT family [Candidatus Thermoplasmatota archaeon]